MRAKKFKTEWIEEAAKLCRTEGYTDQQLADHFGVSKSSLFNYKHEFPEFRTAIQEAKDEFDLNTVERSLLQRALGCSVTELRTNGGGEDGEAPSAVQVTKELPPDVTACIFWLKNRQPGRWRDKQEHDVSVNKVSLIDLTGEDAD